MMDKRKKTTTSSDLPDRPALHHVEARDGQDDQARRNRWLLDWLGDDGTRARLFDSVNQSGGRVRIWSRDTAPPDCDCLDVGDPRAAPPPGHKQVLLITDPDQIETILKDDGKQYSNRVYAALGGGSFMLALDPSAATAHGFQTQAYATCFPHDTAKIRELAHLACQAASITALRAPEFDMGAFAEQAALRFCQKLFGYALADYPLLEKSLRAGYQALVYQVFGRHFATNPTAILLAKQAMGALLTRTSSLIDAYGREDDDALKGCHDAAVPAGLRPVLKGLGEMDGNLNGEQRAVFAAGTAVGTVGNVQAAACIAVKALFESLEKRKGAKGSDWEQARGLAKADCDPLKTTHYDRWKELLQHFLAANPPIPYLPRIKLDQRGEAETEVLLALGGGTQVRTAQAAEDPLIWGLLGAGGTHGCLGKELAWPLVVEIVRHVMALPGLAQRLDARDATPIGLTKRWGFLCDSYPLTHQRERRVTQSSLNVHMRLKAPIRDSADRVREVIRAGAPRIEEALRQSRHIHFAWFELIESDSVLVLHTVYDGPFAAYIQHFALKVGDLFDKIFECIEDPPPMPVGDFPDEFVALILRYNRAPAMGYFFTAYPRSEVAQILRDELARP